MVGGAISGYCAMGSVVSAMTPTSVMTMLMTPAKVGRSMKKCGKFMSTSVAPAPSFSVSRFSDAFFCLRFARRRLFRYRRDFHSGLQQLQTGRDNFLAVLQTAFHNPFSFEKTTSLEVTAFDGIIGLHDEDVFQPLLRADHSVRDECSLIRRCARNAHANKETWRNEVRVPVFYNDSRTHRPRPRIKTVVNEVDCTFVREIGLVSELDPCRDLGRARAHAFPFPAQLYIFEHGVLVGIDFGINRIDRDYCRKQAIGTCPRLNEIAYGDALVAHSAVDRRFDLCELQIQRRGILCRFGRTLGGGSTLKCSSLLIELAGGNRGLAAQLFCAIKFNLGKLELRIHAVDFRRCAIKIRLIRARIDHVKEVSLFNDCARFKMNLGNVSRHARPNLDRFNWIQPPCEFVPFVYLLLDDSNDVNRQSRLLRYGCFLAATSRQGDEQKSGTRKKVLLHLIRFAFI